MSRVLTGVQAALEKAVHGSEAREMPRARSAPAPSKPLPQSRAGSTYGTADWPDPATTRRSLLSRKRVEGAKEAYRCRKAEVTRAAEGVPGGRSAQPSQDWKQSIYHRRSSQGSLGVGKKPMATTTHISGDWPDEMRRGVARDPEARLAGGARRVGLMHDGHVKRVDGGKAVNPELTAVSHDSMFYHAGAADDEPKPRRSRRPTVRTVYAPQVIAHNDWANSRRAARLSYPLRSSVAWQKSEPGGHMADDDRGRFRATALRKWAEGRTMFTRAGTREVDEFRDDTDRAPHW